MEKDGKVGNVGGFVAWELIYTFTKSGIALAFWDLNLFLILCYLVMALIIWQLG